MESSEQVVFESDESSVIFHNYANDHICSKEEILTDNIDPIIYNGMTTIGRKDLITKGVGTVILTWKDDEGKLQTNKFNNVLYFTDNHST